MYDDDAVDDDDAALREALALSMMPDKNEEKPAARFSFILGCRFGGQICDFGNQICCPAI